MKISVCIPCYNSSATLPYVVEDIKAAFSERPEFDLQIVLVNDGTPDGNKTFEVIKQLCEQDKNIIGIDLSRNYGQTNAKMVAIQYAESDIVVFMDDDGQHPASGIFKLVDELIEKDLDVVYAHFASKKHSFFKRITSNMKNKLSEMMGNKPKGIYVSSFSAWNKMVVAAVKNNRNPFISIGAYLMHVTTRFGNVEIEHKERISGKSGYTLKKLLKLWMNGFISFSLVPLRIVTFLGFLCAFGGFIWGIVLVIRKIISPVILTGYTSTIVVILLIGGIVMIFMGIIGEYIGRIYMTVGEMPQFNVRHEINVESDKK